MTEPNLIAHFAPTTDQLHEKAPNHGCDMPEFRPASAVDSIPPAMLVWRANLPFIRDFDFLHLKIPFPWHVKDQELSNIIWLAA
ncbi:hypothetical protein BCR37DRAFT_383327 [Protomyces lactucae-debilis]|uniref:Uncharacterized protein n=1 Tax=Protomyces lactucae-debilis TaxID=2754530 RepID=A0A1Y2F135_PROLT|nr:uncharacterized protein BCR37DRAFT_383327 [Protomyces lactucae-debilis]ORY76675.1 hypothetical protein BCR37DRAFT_383327 [Protomyces lactucae-debilis]